MKYFRFFFHYFEIIRPQWARRFNDLILDMVLHLIKNADWSDESGFIALNEAISGVVYSLIPSVSVAKGLELYEATDSIFRQCNTLRQDPHFLTSYSAFLHRRYHF